MEKISLKNFRNIDDEINFEFAPITILTGANNSGKSNIIKLLVALNDYFIGGDHFFLSFNGANARKHKIDCYQNAINFKNWKRNKKLKFAHERNDYNIYFEFVPFDSLGRIDDISKTQKGRLKTFLMINRRNGSKISLKKDSGDQYKISIDKSIILSINTSYFKGEGKEKLIAQFEKSKEKRLVRIQELMSQNARLKSSDKKYIENIDEIALQNIHLRSSKKQIEGFKANEADMLSAKGTIRSSIQINEDTPIWERNIPVIIERCIEKYMADAKLGKRDVLAPGNWDSATRKLRLNINSFLSITTKHMSADRSHQARIHINSTKDSDISEIFSTVSNANFKKNGEPDMFIRKWMGKFNIGEDFRLRDIEGIATAFEIKDKNGWHNLVDKGFGTGQILPIIMQLGQYLEQNKFSEDGMRVSSTSFPPVLVFEEPEANLHPAFQSLLAEMFHEIAKKRYVRILIETHSEYLIRKLKFLRAQNELLDNEALIYYIYAEDERPDEEDPRIEKIEILENGKLSQPFGKGFFDAADEIEMDLYRLNKKKL